MAIVKSVRIAISSLCLCLPLAGMAAGTLNIQKSAPYEKDLPVPAAVRAECALDAKVPEFVEEAAKGQFDTINMVDKAGGSGRSLSMKITGITGTGGGAWSGPKHITVDGTLTENGKPIGSFKATRYSGGGAFGGYKGTCAILGRCAKAIGKDVANWLEQPSMNARLGDAK